MTMIQCYFLKNFHEIELPTDHLMKLNDAQRLRIKSMSMKRTREFFWGRQLLNFALTKGSSNKVSSNKEWEIIENENNAPLVKLLNTNHSINCSITHSIRWLGVVVCIDVNPPKIGIDIETIRDNWSIEKAKLFCNNSQINQAFELNTVTERNHFLTTLWTQKEAYFKAVGEQVFNKTINLKESSETSYLLASKALSRDSIMSIYSERNAIINKSELCYLNGQFVAI